MNDPRARPPGQHYFAANPVGPRVPQEITIHLDGEPHRVWTGTGVFSASRLDPGTAVLLGADAEVRPGNLLDLGCGYGPIALALALRQPAATVWAVEVNAHARDLARQNAARAGVADRVRVLAPEEVPSSTRFAQVWSNPPIRVGKLELHRMLLHWLGRLDESGEAWLVVARNLGADSLQRWLGQRDYRVARAASRKGYRVLRVDPPARTSTTDPGNVH